MASPHAAYHHTQVGYTMLGAMSLGLIIVAAAAVSTFRTMPPGASRLMALCLEGAALLLVVAAATVFSTLTVDVRDGRLTWHFTGRIISGSAPVGDIVSATPAVSAPEYGWGIRETPDGRLYNISGLHAVRVQMRDGRRFSLGTNEPDRLVIAINGEKR